MPFAASHADPVVRRVVPYPGTFLCPTEALCCKTTCTGSDWTKANAYKSIQDAIADAGDGDEIWVKTGTYYPDECYDTSCTNNDRTSTFTISKANDVALHLYGGFSGTETDRSQRTLFCSGGTNAGRPCETSGDCPGGSCSSTPTKLSGDLLKDDVACTSDANCTSPATCQAGLCSDTRDDNAYHVVTYSTANAVSTLDGFVVIAGQADDSTEGAQKNQGAAMHIRSSALCLAGGPDIANSIFRNNYAIDHSAVNDHALTTEITNCVFKDNLAKEGAAIVVEHGSTKIVNCLFERNTVVASECQSTADDDDDTAQGGAIWLNRASDASCTGPSAPVISNCVFIDNVAEQGGAIWSRDSNVTLEDSTFRDNIATGAACVCGTTATIEGRGGAIWVGRRPANDSPVYASITDCTFGDESDPSQEYNEAVMHGGAIYAQGGDSTHPLAITISDSGFFGCATTVTGFCNGSVYYNGGGAIWAGNTDIVIHRVIFVGNETNSDNGYGGAILTQTANTIAATYCSFFGNHSLIGGAVYVENASSSWDNCVFSGNYAGDGCFGYCSSANHAAMKLAGDATLMNCTLSGNYVVSGTGTGNTLVALMMGGGGELTATNTIFWDGWEYEPPCEEPLDGEVNIPTGTTGTFTNCVIRGGAGAVKGAGTKNFSNILGYNPDFQDADGADNVLGTADDNARPGPSNECINAGTNTGVTSPIDLDAEDRIGGTTVDIGTYEWCSSSSDCADSDCATGTCSATTGNCTVTLGDLPCNTGQGLCCIEGLFCMDGDCCTDVDCGAGEVCCANDCVTGDCCDDSDCDAPLPYCVSNECGE